jgi:hypothetical protein
MKENKEKKPKENVKRIQRTFKNKNKNDLEKETVIGGMVIKAINDHGKEILIGEVVLLNK